MKFQTLVPQKNFAATGYANLPNLILITTIITQMKPVDLKQKYQGPKRFKEFCPLDGQDNWRSL